MVPLPYKAVEADDVTKGISQEEMRGRRLNGPELLQLQEDVRPVEHGTSDVKEVHKEKRKAQVVYAARCQRTCS